MSETIKVRLTDGPLGAPTPLSAAGAGAVLVFEGIVRPLEDGRPLVALHYDAYEPMTTRELGRLARRVVADHGLLALWVEHSVGRVPVGERSFRLTVASAHRKEALEGMGEFIDAMKQSTPLWKTPEH